MGLQQIFADTIQRLTPKISTRSESRSDRASDDFRSLLDKARSAREPEEAAPEDSVAPSDEPREAKEPADAPQDDAADTAAPVVVNVPTPDAGQTPSDQGDSDTGNIELPKPLQPATKQTDPNIAPTVGEGTTSRATQNAQDGANAEVGSEQASTQTNQNTKSDGGTNVSQRHDAIATKSAADASQQATENAANTPVVRKTDDSSKDNTTTRTEQSTQQSKDVARPVAQQNSQTNQNDSNTGERQSQQQTDQHKTAQTQNAGKPDDPSLHDQKIAASIDERRRGDADGAQNNTQPAVQPKPTTAVSARLDVMAEHTAVKMETTPTAVKTVSGDSAAESVGRFLLEAGHNNAGHGASGGVSTTASASASSATTSASPTAQAASTFADTLTAAVDAPESLDSAAQTFRAGGGNGRYQVTMQIDPPELGQIRLQVKMQNQGLTLQVDTESSSVAKLIESRLSQLRDSLAAHGIRIDRADVVVKSPSGSETNTQNQNQNSNQHAGTHGTGDSYGDLPGEGRHAHGSHDEQRQGASWQSDVNEDSENTAGAESENASRGWTNRTAATELSLDLVA